MPPSRIDGLIVDAIGDEVLVYDTDLNRAHALNAVAAAVWELSDGKRDAAALAAAAGARLAEPVSDDAVWRALTQLHERGLLAGELPRRISGPEYSRRQAVRRMGFIGASAAFAAPLVKSIVVPTAAQAGASCVPQGGNCGAGTQTGCDTSGFPPCCPGPGIFCGLTGPEGPCTCQVD